MNEFVGKKLGEVLAFSRLGVELLERGQAALQDTFTDYEELIEALQAQAESIKEVASNAELEEAAEAKAEATGDKLRGMMETYIGEEWDNLAELLEWMGFFEGAAVVHWRLVEGVAESLEDTTLHQLAADGADMHHDLLHRAQAEIKAIGAQWAES